MRAQNVAFMSFFPVIGQRFIDGLGLSHPHYFAVWLGGVVADGGSARRSQALGWCGLVSSTAMLTLRAQRSGRLLGLSGAALAGEWLGSQTWKRNPRAGR